MYNQWLQFVQKDVFKRGSVALTKDSTTSEFVQETQKYKDSNKEKKTDVVIQMYLTTNRNLR